MRNSRKPPNRLILLRGADCAMISTRKVAANRRNAARSTGPSTAGGKARASRNAYKHGLAVSILDDPAISAEVERLARSLVGKRRDLYELAQARDRKSTR